MEKVLRRWAVLWNQRNQAGVTRHFMMENCVPVLFRTRKEARSWAQKHFGYIRNRFDLRREPHGWKVPLAVKVEVKLRIREERARRERESLMKRYRIGQ
jgi:hypothetical protein